jgi:SAM-dependent methyltransferase
MWKRLLPGAAAPPPPRLDGAETDALPVTDEAVIWAMRLFLGREPRDAEELALHRQHAELAGLRRAFAASGEFQDWLGTVAPGRKRFARPAFLRGRPADPAIPWIAKPPTLAKPVSQLCTAAQLDEPAFARAITAIRVAPGYHRKLWEHAWIMAVLEAEGIAQPGRRAIGFGCGRERMPAHLAAQGMEVLATDAPEGAVHTQGWASTRQHAAALADLRHPDIVAPDDFDRLVSFRPVDMNAIPDDLAGQFDACWSACSLEHLGSLAHGLDFIENSLKVLKPGGIAVHTTEFNLSSDTSTIETPGLSIYRRRDIEALLSRLAAQGHQLLPLNLHPGNAMLDAVVDLPPYGLPHLKVQVAALTVTSIGIAVRRRA